MFSYWKGKIKSLFRNSIEDAIANRIDQVQTAITRQQKPLNKIASFSENQQESLDKIVSFTENQKEAFAQIVSFVENQQEILDKVATFAENQQETLDKVATFAEKQQETFAQIASSVTAQQERSEKFYAFLQKKINNILFDNFNYSPSAYLHFKALKDSAALIEEHMGKAMIFNVRGPADKHKVLEYSLTKPLIEGVALEFGVYSGKTINMIAKQLPERVIFGFDSFEGLSEDWSGKYETKGFYAAKEIPLVPDNVTLVKGWFDEALPAFLETSQFEAVAFLHVDCDLYSSTKTIFDNLKKYIKVGTIIVFDEYFNYVNWRNHEYKAFMEFCEAEKVQFEYLAFGRQEVSVEITRIGTEESVS